MPGGSARHQYLIALGSNRRHHGFGPPAKVLDAALIALAAYDIDILAAAPAMITRPVGPSLRSYANSAAVIETTLPPNALLTLLKAVEERFGKRWGQRWSSRTLDLDIILWSGGRWHARRPKLTIPHPLFRLRDFVLAPAAIIAPHWRDPVSGLSVHQLRHRCTRA